MPSQSSQWLQGAFDAPLSVIGAVDGAASAATVMTPLASTARQAKMAAQARNRFTGPICAGRPALPTSSFFTSPRSARTIALDLAGPDVEEGRQRQRHE